MKIISQILKYFSLVLLIFFLLKLTKHFGDYKQTVYDFILISIIIILIVINIIILYKVQKRTKNYKIIKIIFLTGFIGVLINIITNHFAQNITVNRTDCAVPERFAQISVRPYTSRR